MDRLHLDEALARVRAGDDAVVITEDGEEIAAVVSLDEYGRYREFREWEEEAEGLLAQEILDDPNTEWDSWEDVKRELALGGDQESADSR